MGHLKLNTFLSGFLRTQGLLMRAHNNQTAHTPWYTEWGFTV
jgi:hypothetical protein